MMTAKILLINKFIQQQIMLRLSPDKKKFQFEHPACHSRFNQIGRMSLMNRYQTMQSQHLCQLRKSNSPIKLNNKSPKAVSKTTAISRKLPASHRHLRSVTDPISEQFDPESSPRIKEHTGTIRKMGLMGGIALTHIKYEGHIKIPTVHNDYHSAASNPGYSRKPDGGIYPK